ncbi:1,2-phenylacetyl-CoA epoxidase subunit PaaC [Arsenicicoccus dermatophilus]|uniref:1,2-phenylacetyl-CoA epoxidase subunit PaaC n=1 Tax=Arsenicicoccus dermatophilus TaxID=1076331 RepID=UPI003916E74E
MSDTTIAGPSRTVAEPVDLATYVLGLADDALVYTQRLGEWVSRAPAIEEDMAFGNIALDLLGQARALLTYAGQADGTGRTEDDLAYLRDEREFRSVHLVEIERGDFAVEMARLLWFATARLAVMQRLTTSADETLRGVAEKAVKELAYHRDHARTWVVRLGDGTEESHRRMQAGLQAVEPYVAELFDDSAAETAAAEAGVGVRPGEVEDEVRAYVEDVLAEATLTPAEPSRWRSRDGRRGIHARPMGYLLAEMQHIARSHPGATW